MELHAVHGMRFVFQALNHTVFTRRGNLEGWRHTLRSDRQRMITSSEEIVVQSAKDAFTGMVDPGQLSVHRFRRAHDPRTIHLGNSLMAKTDTKDGIASV